MYLLRRPAPFARVTTALLGVCLFGLFPGAMPLGRAASFTPLNFRPHAVSADGSVVVGAPLFIPDPVPEAILWKREGGIIRLGNLPADEACSEALGVSGDGTVVVGRSSSGRVWEAFLWTESAGMKGLGDLPGGPFYSSALAVSSDGRVVVGVSDPGDSGLGPVLWEAFRWTPQGGLRGLGILGEWDNLKSTARAVSADGSIVVGSTTTETGTQAFLWTQARGMRRLHTEAEWTYSQAYALSTDGSVVVGEGVSSVGWEAFRWSQLDGMRGLGFLVQGGNYSQASSVSGDGSIIIGSANTRTALQVFLWTKRDGMRDLKDVLLRDWGLDVSGWQLTPTLGFETRSPDISTDGKTIIGTGVNPEGQAQGWIAHLDGCNDVPEEARITGAPGEPLMAGTLVVLEGGASTSGDPGGTLSFRWEIISGPASIAGAKDQSTVTVRGEDEGPAVIRLTVDDRICNNPASADVALVFRRAGAWMRCDPNGDRQSDLSDAVFTIGHLFLATPPSACGPSSDCNGDGQLDLSDAIFGLTFLFLSGPLPPPPFPLCEDFIGCETNS